MPTKTERAIAAARALREDPNYVRLPVQPLPERPIPQVPPQAPVRNPLLRDQLPVPFAQDPDQQRQFYGQPIPQNRIFAAPAAGDTSAGAASASQASNTIAANPTVAGLTGKKVVVKNSTDGSMEAVSTPPASSRLPAPPREKVTQDNLGDGSTFVRLVGTHASGNVAYNFRGVWSSATSYVVGDEVVYLTDYWLCLTANTNSSPVTGNTHWQVVGSYASFLGAWSSTTTYAAGAEVTYNGNFWVALVTNTNSAPTTSNANWQIAGPTNLDNIADGSSYARTLGAGLSSGYVHNMKDGIGSVRIIKGVGDASTLSLDTEIADGSTYGRVVNTALTLNQVDMTKAGVINPAITTDNLVKNGDFSQPNNFNWSNPQGSGTFFTSGKTLPRGAGEFISSATVTWLLSKELVPIDQTKTYFVEAWFKIPAASAGNVHCYGGFAEYDLNGNAVAHDVSGAAFGYCLFQNIGSTTGNTWQYFSAEVTGNGGTSPSSTQFNQAAAYIGAMFLMPDGGTASACEVCGIRISEVAAGATRAIFTISPNPSAGAGLDNIPDGSVHGRTLQTALTGNQVDMSKSGVINRVLTNIADDATYSKTLGTALTGNQVDLAKAGVVNKVLSNIADDASYVKLAATHAAGNVSYNFKGAWSSATSYVVADEVTSNNIYWIALANNSNSQPTTSNANWLAVGRIQGDIQIFTASGTWSKPASGSLALITVIGGGSGGTTGGSGGTGAPSAGGTGGPGGSPGGLSSQILPLSVLGATESITIGAGGASDTNGGASSFGAWLQATGGLSGGAAGKGNVAAGGTSFFPGAGGTGNNGGGISSGGGTSSGANGVTGSSGATARPTPYSGGSLGTGGAGGTTGTNGNSAGNGTNASTDEPAGGGGGGGAGGGGSSSTGTAGNGGVGGNGGKYGSGGGGGGGGGASNTGTPGSGAVGGSGASGIIIVVTY